MKLRNMKPSNLLCLNAPTVCREQIIYTASRRVIMDARYPVKVTCSMALEQVTMSMPRRMTDMINPSYRCNISLTCLYIRRTTFEIIFVTCFSIYTRNVSRNSQKKEY